MVAGRRCSCSPNFCTSRRAGRFFESRVCTTSSFVYHGSRFRETQDRLSSTGDTQSVASPRVFPESTPESILRRIRTSFRPPQEGPRQYRSHLIPQPREHCVTRPAAHRIQSRTRAFDAPRTIPKPIQFNRGHRHRDARQQRLARHGRFGATHDPERTPPPLDPPSTTFGYDSRGRDVVRCLRVPVVEAPFFAQRLKRPFRVQILQAECQRQRELTIGIHRITTQVCTE